MLFNKFLSPFRPSSTITLSMRPNIYYPHPSGAPDSLYPDLSFTEHTLISFTVNLSYYFFTICFSLVKPKFHKGRNFTLFPRLQCPVSNRCSIAVLKKLKLNEGWMTYSPPWLVWLYSACCSLSCALPLELTGNIHYMEWHSNCSLALENLYSPTWIPEPHPALPSTACPGVC